jgi:hypothetical protein
MDNCDPPALAVEVLNGLATRTCREIISLRCGFITPDARHEITTQKTLVIPALVEKAL